MNYVGSKLNNKLKSNKKCRNKDRKWKKIPFRIVTFVLVEVPLQLQAPPRFHEARRDLGPETRSHWRFNSEGILVNRAMQ